MRLTVVHETCYRHDSPVMQSTQLLRLTPPELAGQHVVAWRLQAEGLQPQAPDAYGNILHLLSIQGEHERVSVTAFGTVEIHAMPVREADQLSPLLFLRPTPLTEPDATLRDFSLRFRGRRPSPARLRELAAAVRSCCDGARPAGSVGLTHAFISVCRLLGLPARFVSGYLFRAAEPEAVVQRLHSHAWAEVWLNGGWHSVDVAGQCSAGPCHVRLAIGQDYLDACPMRSMRQDVPAHVMAMQQQQQ